jgi:hypothetical protein
MGSMILAQAEAELAGEPHPISSSAERQPAIA